MGCVRAWHGILVPHVSAACMHVRATMLSYLPPSFSSCAIDTESNTLYWGTVFTIPAGATLTLEGQFPHSRYMSFISYDEMGRPIQSVADYLIKPSAGSRNPFITGADRTVTKRDYRLEVVPARPDSNVPTGMSAPDKVSVKLQACPSVHCRSSRTSFISTPVVVHHPCRRARSHESMLPSTSPPSKPSCTAFMPGTRYAVLPGTVVGSDG